MLVIQLYALDKITHRHAGKVNIASQYVFKHPLDDLLSATKHAEQECMDREFHCVKHLNEGTGHKQITASQLMEGTICN